MMLERLAQLVAELNKTTSSKLKVQILRTYPDLQPILQSIYSDAPFGITSKSIGAASNSSASSPPISDLGDLVGMLAAGRLKNSKASAAALSDFSASHRTHLGLIRDVVDKNLRVRIGAGLLHQAFPPLSPLGPLPIALAAQPDSLCRIKEHIGESLSKGDEWMYSRKVDGVRCIARISGRQVQLMSRRSKPFRSAFLSSAAFGTHFDHLLRLNDELRGEDVYLDGELAVVERLPDGGFAESFAETIRVCMSEKFPNHDVAGRLCYFVFDCLTESEVRGGGRSRLGERLSRLKNLSHPFGSRVGPLPQYPLLDHNEGIDTIITKHVKDGNWEGAILRKNAPYIGKRSSDMIKLKLFRDAEYRVVDMEVGPMRFVDSGVEREQILCRSLIIEHISPSGKRCPVSVGSGMSIHERRLFASNPSTILDKMVTVKYFEETEANDGGSTSLRFPIFKGIRENI